MIQPKKHSFCLTGWQGMQHPPPVQGVVLQKGLN